MKPLFTLFKRREDGVAYVEFAIALPFLLALFMGAVEVTRYILIVQKLDKASATMSDIVAQSNTISATQLNQMFTAVSQVMLPYTFTNSGYIIVSSISRSGVNPPALNWQHPGPAGGLVQPSRVTSGSSITNLPIASLDDKENIIVAEVFYNFSPLLPNSVLNNVLIYKVAVFKPRLGTLLTLGP